MWPVSERWNSWVKQSHKVSSRVEIYDGNSLVGELSVSSGGVQMDAHADVQRSLRCSLADATGDLTPADLHALLAPAGNELQCWRGIYMPGIPYTSAGYFEEVPLCRVGIADVDVQGQIEGGTIIGLTGFDRAKRIQEARFSTPYVIAAATNYATAIQNLIRDRLPGLTMSFEFASTNNTTPLLVFQVGDDPWKAVQDMASSIGMECFFNGLGNPVLRDVPDPENDPVVAEYAEGPDSVIISADKKLTREHTFNGVIASGESTAVVDQASAPVTATVWDDNPTSPTYYLGKFGMKPRLYASPFITNVDQAMSAAAAMLRQSVGLAEDVRFAAIVNPAHEPGDVVAIAVTKAKIDARYVLDSFTVPLTHAEFMDATTRRRAT